MSDAEKLKDTGDTDVQRLIDSLTSERDYYKSEAVSIWAELKKAEAKNLEIAQHIVKHDSMAVANIVLNMYFGKMPSDSVSFCEIFGLMGRGCPDGKSCTACIDAFLMQYYLERSRQGNAG